MSTFQYFLCTDIKWDLDDKEYNVTYPDDDMPKKLVIGIIVAQTQTTDEEIEEMLGEQMAKEYGTAHKGFLYEPIDIIH